MEKIKLVGRNSRLSLLQIDIVKQKIQSVFPHVKVEVIARNTKGDTLQNIPLHTVEGNDFFTQEIFDALANGDADIAVHSLKDMSSEHFFGKNKFAVVDRDDVRDVAIFNSIMEEKLEKGETISVGTCSPRREEMATVFLKKALPQLNREIKIETKPIRGNVETRLRKLDTGEYDGTILSTAGINRLLQSEKDRVLIKSLLADKKQMLLPLIECVPAPCQGALVAEAHYSNARAIEVLEKINDKELFIDCYNEKREAVKYGTGCIQKFGFTTIKTRNSKYLYAAGKDAEGTEFVKWDSLPDLNLKNESVFSSTDIMRGFFNYEWNNRELKIERPVVFVANYKAIQDNVKSGFLKDKLILASGTKCWYELANQGYWVTACADALGFEFLLLALAMPLLNIQAENITLLTHEAAAARWRKKGYNTASNYKLISKENESIHKSVATADAIFWTSFSQYEFYGKYTRPGAIHVCSGGETAELLKASGIEPVIFPTIKAFELWRKSFIRPHSVA